MPFTFRVPADFTNAAIDQGDTRGSVIGATGLTKVDVIAVRRVTGGIVEFQGRPAPPHQVLGHAVRSELRPVPGWQGWVLECQYTPDFAKRVRDACDEAVSSVARR